LPTFPNGDVGSTPADGGICTPAPPGSDFDCTLGTVTITGHQNPTTLSDDAAIAGLISATAFALAAIPSPATPALAAVGMALAVIAATAQVADNHSHGHAPGVHGVQP